MGFINLFLAMLIYIQFKSANLFHCSERKLSKKQNVGYQSFSLQQVIRNVISWFCQRSKLVIADGLQMQAVAYHCSPQHIDLQLMSLLQITIHCYVLSLPDEYSQMSNYHCPFQELLSLIYTLSLQKFQNGFV